MAAAAAVIVLIAGGVAVLRDRGDDDGDGPARFLSGSATPPTDQPANLPGGAPDHRTPTTAGSGRDGARRHPADDGQTPDLLATATLTSPHH